MTGTALILGANGRFGRAATQAFATAGWQVRAATRKGNSQPRAGVSPVAFDVMDRDAVVAAAQGADIIVHAVHPLYPDWAEMMPVHTENIIAAARASGSTVMTVGNVYTFGEHAPELYSESLTPAPTTRKGHIRLAMERSFEAAAAQDVRSVILRSGDFIEREKTGNWFDTYMTNRLHKDVFTYPGPRDVVHAWSYLPDMARAMVALAEKRDTLPAFSSFGYEGYSLTGDEIHEAVEHTLGRPLKAASFPWPLMRVLALFSPLVREVLEMRYLWEVPHRVDGAPLAAVLPDFTPTPLDEALRHVLSQQPAARTDQGRDALHAT